jgi:hypothetical protein
LAVAVLAVPVLAVERALVVVEARVVSRIKLAFISPLAHTRLLSVLVELLLLLASWVTKAKRHHSAHSWRWAAAREGRLILLALEFLVVLVAARAVRTTLQDREPRVKETLAVLVETLAAAVVVVLALLVLTALAMLAAQEAQERLTQSLVALLLTLAVAEAVDMRVLLAALVDQVSAALAARTLAVDLLVQRILVLAAVVLVALTRMLVALAVPVLSFC